MSSFDYRRGALNASQPADDDAKILAPDLPVESWSDPKLGAKIEGEGEELLHDPVLPSDRLQATPNRLLDLAMRLGVLLLQNGAETYRVEDSVSRVLTAYKANEPSSFAVPSLVAISFKDDEGNIYSKTQRVNVKGANLDRVYRLNTLSRYLTANSPDLDYFDSALDEVADSYVYKDWMVILGSAALAGAFTIMFGGVVSDIWIAILAGICTRWVVQHLVRMELNSVFFNIIGAAVATVITEIASNFGLVQDAGIVTISVLMNLVPGALLTNAIRDIIATDYMSGITKLTEALMVAASLAIGAGVGYGLGGLIGGF